MISMRTTNLWSFRKTTSASYVSCSKKSISNAKSAIKVRARIASKTSQKEARNVISTKVFIIVRSVIMLDQWILKTKFWEILWTILTLFAMTNVNKLILSMIWINTNKETSVGLVTKDPQTRNQDDKNLLLSQSLNSQELLLSSNSQLFLLLSLSLQVKMSKTQDQPRECATCCKKTQRIFTLLISKIHQVEFSKVDFKINSHIIFKL